MMFGSAFKPQETILLIVVSAIIISFFLLIISGILMFALMDTKGNIWTIKLKPINLSEPQLTKEEKRKKLALIKQTKTKQKEIGKNMIKFIQHCQKIQHKY